MTLTADIAVTLGTFHLDASLVVDEAVVAVVGPNGSGKTTLLRALAGLIPLTSGAVVVDGRRLEDVAARIRVTPEDRQVGVVFQDHLLFDHMSALDNVAFGLRARGVARTEARRQAAAWLERVGLSEMSSRRPRRLSGGQAQKVALARTLATEPSVLLLDEPLAAVDVSARAELRRMIRNELRRYPGARIIVTHDPIEAATLADRLLVLEDGKVTQQGALTEVTAHPRSAWVATMVGLNLVRGKAHGTAVVLASGQYIVGSTTTTSNPKDGTAVAGTTVAARDVFAAFRPNAVTLHRSPPEGSARNVWAGTACEVHPAGDRARVSIEGPMPLVAEVTAAAVSALRLADGGPIWASVKATEVEVYPA